MRKESTTFLITILVILLQLLALAVACSASQILDESDLSCVKGGCNFKTEMELCKPGVSGLCSDDTYCTPITDPCTTNRQIDSNFSIPKANLTGGTLKRYRANCGFILGCECVVHSCRTDNIATSYLNQYWQGYKD